MDEDLLRCTIDVKRLVQRTIIGQRKKPRRGDPGRRRERSLAVLIFKLVVGGTEPQAAWQLAAQGFFTACTHKPISQGDVI